MPDPKETFLHLLLNDFERGFGPRMGRMVVDYDLYETALHLAIESHQLPFPSVVQTKIAFRAAYALENAFFIDMERFVSNNIDTFIETFPLATNRSVHRHFGKMMATLLHTKRLIPTSEQASSIAETAALWLSDPKSRVAVKIWALEVLKLLTPQVNWVKELLPDAIGLLSQHPSPAMSVRIRRGNLLSLHQI